MERKLTFILAADIVGYSSQTEVDEDAALSKLRQMREIVDPILQKFDGRIFNTAGDSVLAEFPDPLSALQSAVEFQRSVASRNKENDAFLQLRVGINLGYVSVEGDNLLGEGVNVAARLESFCLPGGIAISRNFYDLVHNKTDIEFDDVGVQTIKNTKVHVFDAIFMPSQERRKTSKTKRRVILMSMSLSIVIFAGILLLVLYNPTELQNFFQKQGTQKAQTPSARPYDSLGFLQLENKSGFVRYDNVSQKVSEYIFHNLGDSTSLTIDAYFREKPLTEVLKNLNDSGTHDLKFLIYGYLTERINDYKLEIRIHDLLNNNEKGKFSLYVESGNLDSLSDHLVQNMRDNIRAILRSRSRRDQIMTMDGQFIDLKKN